MIGRRTEPGPMCDVTVAPGCNSAHRRSVVEEIARRLGVPVAQIGWVPLPSGRLQALWSDPAAFGT